METAKRQLDDDPHWFRRAVFYEVMIRGFKDSNGDGIGDFQGLISKLDYFSWLGIDCLWLLPWYPSPMRDNGYDISDYHGVHPDFGSADDVAELLDAAHQRGIRVIADLVVNHTSDQHPWFVESRSDRTNPKADWYVWSDDPERWSEARVIFIDTESSNWTWDDVRGQYFWHRFFSHQPDLNYDCPDVTDAIFDAMSFWLEMGLDGLRLDAVPYLFERDGTNGENLPETHDWLKRLRARVDETFPGRVLLAEANQMPADVVEYFGDGDECHMAFHFPVMPRMYRALRDHLGDTIADALAETPPIPDGCQWGMFLRNHDELTLEMVTDEERAFMYEAYAPEEGMRRNVGIGRRLAPLVDDDRRQIELLHSLLLSLPGSPVLYYGDELGMGERMELGDRDPVRTPMQWDASPTGGFSAAPVGSLYLPPVDDPTFGYAQRNVATAMADPNSLANWIRSMLDLRSRVGVLGTANYTHLVTPEHSSLFAYLRGPDVLCAVNVGLDAVVIGFDDIGVGSDALGPSSINEVLASSPGAKATVSSGGSGGELLLDPYGWIWVRLEDRG